jgi:uncharacterized UBP type Zn finger protein
MASVCDHSSEIRVLEPEERVCSECLQEGTHWVALHLCTTCGHVGCCISSPGGHAKKHYLETGHPVIRSTERGWFWCYPDKRYVQPEGSPGSHGSGLLARVLGRDR